MSAKTFLYKFKEDGPYLSDQGVELSLNPSLRAPSDLADDTDSINSILECIGAEALTSTAPCGERGQTTPRKLTFIRTNRNSFSLTIPNRSEVVKIAQCVWDILKDTNFKAICVQYHGEHSLNLIEQLAKAEKAAPTPAAEIAPGKEDGFNAFVYSNVMKEYKSDTPFGKIVLMPFRSQTDTKDKPYSVLSSYFSSCVDPTTTVTCAGASSEDYRRYIPSILTKRGEAEILQTVTVPVKGNEASAIKTCGETLAAIPSVLCIEYFGASNKKLHKLLT